MDFEKWLMDCLAKGSGLPIRTMADEVIDTELGLLNLTKAMELAYSGELTLVPLRRGITDIKLNTLLYDILTERGFSLNLLTGSYEPPTLRNAGTTGSQRQAC